MGCVNLRVLVVDDDAALAEMLGIVLRGDDIEPVFCADGSKALDVFHQARPDVVLLDVMLPGTSGGEIARQIRAESDVPIIMLTALTETADVVAGLQAGADDYVTKPFKPRELLARIRAQGRRTGSAGNEVLRLADLVIVQASHTVTRDGEHIALTPLEFDLLTCLARRPWQVFTREELLKEVWGYQHASDTRLVNVHVQRLRAKVELDPEHPQVVLTVRGVGYRAGGASTETPGAT